MMTVRVPYHEVVSKFYNVPLLLTPASAHTVSAVLFNRMDAASGRTGASDQAIETVTYFDATARKDGSTKVHSPRNSRFVGEYERGEDGEPRPYRVTENGIAIITIVGELVNRGAWVGASSGLVSYEGIAHQVTTAVKDARVRSMVLDVDSPGGEAIGCYEVAEVIRKAAAVKPIVGHANGWAASAAYGLLSGCTWISSIPSGGTGSIGVVLVHLDFAAYLESEGVKPTLIFEGAHKVDGNPYEPLPESVRDRLQAEVRKHYNMFVATVAAGRPGLDPAAIRATEARVYTGEEARAAGLVDRVGTFDDVLAELSRPVSGRGSNQLVTKGVDMRKANGALAAQAGNAAPAAACGTCGADECACGDKCTGASCGCCDACGAVDEGEGGGDGGEGASAASASSGNAPVNVAAIQAENRRLREQLASAKRTEVTLTARNTIDSAVRAGKMAPMQTAREGKPAAETAASLLYETLAESALNGACATCTATHGRTERMVALMPPLVPGGRLPVKPLRDTAAVVGGHISASSEQGEMHAAIVQKLTAEGLQPGTKKWNKAYKAEHSAMAVGAAE